MVVPPSGLWTTNSSNVISESPFAGRRERTKPFYRSPGRKCLDVTLAATDWDQSEANKPRVALTLAATAVARVVIDAAVATYGLRRSPGLRRTRGTPI